MTALRRLGYWQSPERPDLPHPAGFIDMSWGDAEREFVARYFRHATVARVYMGTERCRVCGAVNGSAELSDGTYLWPEGLAHYIEEHSVRLPAEAERHALARTTELEDTAVDEAWWLSATSA